jgi:hypothetical protein
MANKVLLTAVGTGEVRSVPFVVYSIKDAKLPQRLSLVLEDRVSEQTGVEEVRLSNVECGLIKSNTAAYTEGLFKGFRRQGEDGRTFVVVEVFSDNIPKTDSLLQVEPF